MERAKCRAKIRKSARHLVANQQGYAFPILYLSGTALSIAFIFFSVLLLLTMIDRMTVP